MTSRKAFEQRITAVMRRCERTFKLDGVVVVPPVIVRTVEDCWCALYRDHDFDRVERLIAVVGLLIEREGKRFKADPSRYAARQRELAAA
jgi:hypothetical protein